MMDGTRTALKFGLAVAVICVLGVLGSGVSAQDVDTASRVEDAAAGTADNREFTSNFTLYEVDLVPTGRNPFFILEPGYRLILESETERLIITVLNKTRTIKGVVTRIVEERHFEDGSLVELSLNYFAISRKNNSVFYFGEDVDIFENGRIVSHEGAWRAGINGAREGLIMPGIVLLGARYMQEVAPEVALDRAEVVAVDKVVRVSGALFNNVIVTKETTPLEPGVVEFKSYSSGIGLIKDADLELVDFGFLR